MRRSLLLTVVLSIALLSLPGQAGWMRNYGDADDESGVYVEETEDSGYIVIANTYSTEMKEDIWLLKTNASGDTLWTRQYGGAEDDWATSGQVTSDGGYVVAGVSCSFGAGDYDVWLLRLDEEGDTLWTRVFGDSAYEAANFVSETADEGFVIAGYREGELNELYGYVEPGDIWLIKVTAAGGLTWNKRYGRKDESDEAYCVRQTSDGGYIMGCHAFFHPATLSHAKLMKTNENGDSLWTYMTNKNWWFNSVEETSEGEYVVGGNFNIKAGIAKINAQGDLLWEHDWGTQNNNWANCVRKTPDGGYILTGLYDAMFPGGSPMNGDLWLIKTGEAGDTTWTRIYGSNPQFDYGNCVALTSDGGYVITGLTASYSNGGYDVWLIKTDSDGNVMVDENPIAERFLDFEIANPIGREIVVRYTDCPEGFRAQVYDASGRKVSELRSSSQSGTLVWGDGYAPGVYFVKVSSNNLPRTMRVILTR